MERPENKKEMNWATGRRSVTDILARRRIEREKFRQILPPDYEHGDAVVGELYKTLGTRWAERALFAVDDGEVMTVAYFDDHFLVIEQWSEESATDWRSWWRGRRSLRDRVIALDLGYQARLSGESMIGIDIGRQRLRRLERGVLGLMRDAMIGDESLQMRLCRGRVDVLSLVTLTNQLLSGET